MALGRPSVAAAAVAATTLTGCPVVTKCDPYSEVGCEGMENNQGPAERGEVIQRPMDSGDTGMVDTGMTDIADIQATVGVPDVAELTASMEEVPAW